MKILNGRPPEYLFLTHAHFDHCGSAAYLKKAFPGMKVAGSKRLAEIISRPNAIKIISALSQAGRATIEKWFPDLASEETFQPFTVDLILADGDRIDLGHDLHIEVLATPGHTWDSLSYYLPEKKILIASESAGCLDSTGYMFTEFLVDYQTYLESINRLSQLDVEIFCQGHGAVLTGEEAKYFFTHSLEAAQTFKKTVEEYLQAEGGDIRKTVNRIKALEYDPKPEPKQPEPAYQLNIEARVKHLAKLREAKSSTPK
jgi:glyoxylase-like metal-dependent hydrolase (beta-lactamase superfamily II)